MRDFTDDLREQRRRLDEAADHVAVDLAAAVPYLRQVLLERGHR